MNGSSESGTENNSSQSGQDSFYYDHQDSDSAWETEASSTASDSEFSDRVSFTVRIETVTTVAVEMHFGNGIDAVVDVFGSENEQLALAQMLSEIVYGEEQDRKRTKLSPHQIQTLKETRTIDFSGQGETCTICMDEDSESKEGIKLDCQHSFHTECISKWLGMSDSCPVCREHVVI